MTESNWFDLPIRYAKLRPEDFPFTIEQHDDVTGELLWSMEVTGAGALRIPGHPDRAVRVTIIDKNGERTVIPVDRGARRQLIACRPIDPEQYSLILYDLWRLGIEALDAKGLPHPPIYPGSVTGECCECGIQVAIGPMQQKMQAQYEEVSRPMEAVCLLCSVLIEGGADVRSLGNPYQP